MESLIDGPLSIQEIEKKAFLFAQRNDPEQELFYCQMLIDRQVMHQSLLARICFLFWILKKNNSFELYEKQLIQKELFFYFLAEHYFKENQFRKAFCFFLKSFKLKPENLSVICRMVSSLYHLKKKKIAFSFLSNSLSQHPKSDALWCELGVFWMLEGDFDKAQKSFIKALQINTNHFFSNYNLAILLNIQFKMEESFYYSRKAEKIDPNNPHVHNVIGNSFRLMGEFQQAMNCYRRCLDINPNHVDALGNMASCYEKLNLFQEAEPLYEKAIALKKIPEIESNYALFLLRKKNFSAGWRFYESRIKIPNQKTGIQQFCFPQWQGENLNGKTIFIWSEQGIGDQIMSLFVLKELDDAYQDLTICLQTEPRLLDLIKRSFSFKNNFYLFGDFTPDYQVSILSMLRFFRKTDADFSKSSSYLKADPEKTNEFKNISNKRKMAISWKTKNKECWRYRNCNLFEWASFLDGLEDTDIFSAQYSDEHVEIEQYNKHAKNKIQLIETLDPMKDLDQFSAFLSAMDMVISIDNSTVHLSGALGITTSVLLPLHSDWRWFVDDEYSLWYPSVQLLRQDKPGDWQGVFKKLNMILGQKNEK